MTSSCQETCPVFEITICAAASDKLFGGAIASFYPGMQPIAGEGFPQSQSGLSRHIELVRAAFDMVGDAAAMSAVSRREVVDLLSQGRSDDLMDNIYSAFAAYRNKHDVVVLEGSHSGAYGFVIAETATTWGQDVMTDTHLL